jgi:hypothetical protein
MQQHDRLLFRLILVNLGIVNLTPSQKPYEPPSQILPPHEWILGQVPITVYIFPRSSLIRCLSTHSLTPRAVRLTIVSLMMFVAHL